MTKFWHNHQIKIYLLLCLLLFCGNALASSKSNTDQQIPSVDAFFDRLGTINDPIQLVNILGTCERLQQLKFVQEQLNLRLDQQQLVDQEHQELIIKLYRQLFGLSNSYNVKKDQAASKVISSLLQKFTPDELLHQFQNNLPLPNDKIAPRESSYYERLMGFVTFINIIWAMSIFLFVFSLASLIKALNLYELLRKIINCVPTIFWEFLAHTTCFSIIYRAKDYNVGSSRRNYIALTGCLLWFPVWLWFFSLRKSTFCQFLNRKPDNLALKVMVVICATTATIYQSHVIGTLTLQVMLALLGFSVSIYKTVAFLGFDSRNELVRCKFFSGILLLIFLVPAYILLNINSSYIKWLAPFETGILFWCTLVYHIALLIDSIRYTGWNLLLEIFSFVFTLWCGTVYNIEQMKSIGGTFLVWWFFFQMGRIDWQDVGMTSAMLLLSIVMWQLCYVIQSYPEYFFSNPFSQKEKSNVFAL
jgi:hypothetical protein